MRAAEIRFFWYRAELFSLFSRLPRARCSRGAPFLFFPSSTRRAKKTRGASETTRQWYASNEFKSLPKESTCSENVEFPLSRFCPQKVLDRKGTARKGVLPRKTRAQSRVTKGRREKVIWGAGEGVKPPRKSVSPSRKRRQGKTKQSSNSFLFLSLGCWRRDLSP